MIGMSYCPPFLLDIYFFSLCLANTLLMSTTNSVIWWIRELKRPSPHLSCWLYAHDAVKANPTLLIWDLIKLTLWLHLSPGHSPSVGNLKKLFHKTQWPKAHSKNVIFTLRPKMIQLYFLVLWKAKEKRARISHTCAKLLKSSPMERSALSLPSSWWEQLEQEATQSPEGLRQECHKRPPLASFFTD